MVVPIRDETAQQIWPAQEGTVTRSRSAYDDVVAAAGTSMTAIEHELLCTEPRLTRFFVQRRRARYQLTPGVGGMHIDFDHTGIRRHREVIQPRVDWRLFALDNDWHAQRRGSALDGGKQIE